MPVALLAALVCFAAWVGLVFVRPVGLGVVHLLYGVSALLWIRWWALKPVRGQR